jgi:hypothetical protein
MLGDNGGYAARSAEVQSGTLHTLVRMQGERTPGE